MITAYLDGGLGNYMFQIAAAASLAEHNNDNAIFSELDSRAVHHGIDKYKFNILRNVDISHQIIPDVRYQYYEPKFSHSEIEYSKGLRLIGYFQSEKYFYSHDYIRRLYRPSEEIINYIDSKYRNLINGNSCSIHIRRGDYVSLPEYHPLCTIEYYNEAMQHMPKDTHYLIFSDDKEWCKENFIGDNFTIIENELDYIDLYLMSFCRNNIIANSSFSWWGAWLNNFKDKIVIAPNKWFGEANSNYETKDIIPDNWIKI